MPPSEGEEVEGLEEVVEEEVEDDEDVDEAAAARIKRS